VNAQRHKWPSYLSRESHTPSTLSHGAAHGPLRNYIFCGFISTLYPRYMAEYGLLIVSRAFAYEHSVSIALFRMTRLSVGALAD